MRKRVKISRDKDHRKALFKNLISALILEGKIKTTERKAKALKSLVDKFINQAKDNNPITKNQVASFLTTEKAVAKLYQELVPRFKDQSGGFTRILGYKQRRGDNATIFIVEWSIEKDKKEKKI